MKAFLRNDHYIQLSIFLAAGCIALTGLLIGKERLILVFYFGVGFSQLISYCIRLSYKYEKSLIFKIYGFLIIPIFPSLLALYFLGNWEIGFLFLIIPMLSVFYSPVMAGLYLFDNYKTCQHIITAENVGNIS